MTVTSQVMEIGRRVRLRRQASTSASRSEDGVTLSPLQPVVPRISSPLKLTLGALKTG
ncbi:hypothetical protein BraRD5C2_39830 [Bradyrhizobium sp. RD5-C2]|nr:hypothetical protein BraRD5C2_39830 [Bradyrhizobium sp. RD5-C2]